MFGASSSGRDLHDPYSQLCLNNTCSLIVFYVAQAKVATVCFYLRFAYFCCQTTRQRLRLINVFQGSGKGPQLCLYLNFEIVQSHFPGSTMALSGSFPFLNFIHFAFCSLYENSTFSLLAALNNNYHAHPPCLNVISYILCLSTFHYLLLLMQLQQWYFQSLKSSLYMVYSLSKIAS